MSTNRLYSFVKRHRRTYHLCRGPYAKLRVAKRNLVVTPIKHYILNPIRYVLRYRIGYNANMYLKNIHQSENKSWYMGIIRPGDMGAAILYALGIRDYASVQRIFDIPNDPTILPGDTNCLEQAQILREHMSRVPELVIDAGCGRGELSATLTYLSVPVIPIDPSRGALELLDTTYEKFYGLKVHEFVNKGIYDGLRHVLDSGRRADTVIFCESIEHIEKHEIEKTMGLIRTMMSERGGLVIITNWHNFHPIKKEPHWGWNHITRIDDDFYDWLESFAKSTVHIATRKSS